MAKTKNALEILRRRRAKDSELQKLYEEETINLKVATLIRKAREEAGLTQEGLAQKNETQMTHYSPSQINQFLRCPQQWAYRYIDGLKIPPSGALTQGISVHKAMEVNFSQKISTQTDLPIAEVVDAYSTEFDKAIVDTILAPDEDKGTLKDQGVAVVEVAQIQMAPSILPIAVEKPYEVAFENVPYTLKVIPDIITAVGVHEIKTSAKTPSEVSQDYLLQGSAQVLATGIKEVSFEYLVKTKTPKYVKIERTFNGSDQEFLLNIIAKVDATIKAGTFIPNRGSWLCSKRTCGYWQKCVAQNHGTVRD